MSRGDEKRAQRPSWGVGWGKKRPEPLPRPIEVPLAEVVGIRALGGKNYLRPNSALAPSRLIYLR